MHDGFSGGAFVDTTGALLGVTTALSIRGLGVVIPASIAWRTAGAVLEHGRLKRGYLGLAGQPVALPGHQQQAGTHGDRALLVVGVTDGSPAAAAGMLVGDLLCTIDDHPIASPEDLLDQLTGNIIGKAAVLRVIRGGSVRDLTVTVGERPER